MPYEEKYMQMLKIFKWIARMLTFSEEPSTSYPNVGRSALIVMVITLGNQVVVDSVSIYLYLYMLFVFITSM